MPDWDLWETYRQQTACDHMQIQPTRAKKSNGVICVYLQCKQCGDKIREVRKAGYDVDRLPWFDEQFRERQLKRNEVIRERLRWQWFSEQKDEQKNKQGEFWEKYNAYLQSPHWGKLRRQVIVRDGFRCQNCFQKVTDATAHVHHLSYVGFRRIGHSFAFEVVTLCRNCHLEYHTEDTSEEAQDVAVPF